MIRRLILPVLLLGLLALPGQARAQQTGLYDVTGTNPDGTAYRGTLLFQQVGLVSWRVVWSIAGDRIEGVGVSAGNIFSAAYELGQRPAIGIYNVNPDGSMSGQWSVVGSSGIGTEMLTPQPAPATPAPAPR